MEINSFSQGRQEKIQPLNIKSADSNVDAVNVSLQPKVSQVEEIQPNNNNKDNRDMSGKDAKDLKDAVNRLNKFLEGDGTKVVFEQHDKFKNDTIIKIVDKNGNVLSEVPPKKILDMVAKMCEMVGVLFDKKA